MVAAACGSCGALCVADAPKMADSTTGAMIGAGPLRPVEIFSASARSVSMRSESATAFVAAEPPIDAMVRMKTGCPAWWMTRVICSAPRSTTARTALSLGMSPPQAARIRAKAGASTATGSRPALRMALASAVMEARSAATSRIRLTDVVCPVSSVRSMVPRRW